MATETLQPDSLDLQTNLSGSLTDIDEGVASADGLWLTADSNNANSVCRVSFPTPSGTPNTGAGLQEFKWWMRLTPNASSCSYSIYVCEGGTRLNGGSPIGTGSLTSTSGQTLSATWDATLLGTADGSACQAEIEVTKSGGSPGNRTTGEVGAVDWVVDYTAAGNNYNESITASATAALTESNVITFNPSITASATAALSNANDAALAAASTVATTAGLSVSELMSMTEAITASAAATMITSGGLAIDDGISLTAVGVVSSQSWKEINDLVSLATAAGLSASSVATLVAQASVAGVSGLSADAANQLVDQVITASATAALGTSGGMVLNEAINAGVAAGLTSSVLNDVFASITKSATASVVVDSTAVLNVDFTMSGTGAIAAAYQYTPVGGPTFVVYIYQINVLEG